ncbi:MAG: hypothetical protein K5981_00550, partial [Clostridia bacterium]|nr:hypothetical protein [Clostridia bacterium]
AATCTAFGSFERVIRCTVCNKALSTQTEPIDPLGHTWGDWTVVTPATETSEGSESRTCSRCGEAETRSIPKLSHVHILKKTEAVDPTCTEAGNSAYWTCSGCGKHFSDAAGSEEIELSAASIPALGHAYTAAVTAPTCTEGGYTTHTCSRCGDKYKDEETAALGHNWSEWIEVYPASIYEAGSEKRMCGRCGVTEFRDIPQLPDPTVRLSGSANGDELTYSAVNAPDGSFLIAARYEDGRLTDLQILGGGADSGTLTMGGSGAEYSLFLVDAGGKPLCPDWSN